MPAEKTHNKQRVAVIGSGFAGLSAASYLASAGFDVHVYEKNEHIGGRARKFTAKGYTFDMGPSWYWMPDVFEQFFKDFNYKVSDLYELSLLDPGFSIVFGRDEVMDLPNSSQQLEALFESIEPGSAKKLNQFLAGAEFKYKVGMNKLVHKPGISLTEFIDLDVVKGAFKLQLFQSFRNHVGKYFRHPKLIALMEFPILFLGATAKEIPALYSLMNYAGLKLGTWYPKGGLATVIDAMKVVAEKQGVKFFINEPIVKINVDEGRAKSITTHNGTLGYDGIVASADYHHVENSLLEPSDRNYSEAYWDKRVMAPSSLIFYLGVNKKVDRIKHHTLFFDENLDDHAKDIYETPQWPQKPLFYVCCPSKSDESVAPEGHENLFVLMPLAPGITDTEEIRAHYFQLIINRLENFTGQSLIPHIDYKKMYCINDFVQDYNAYKGNAYGLANTLSQTAILKPSIKNKKVNNLFYAGQLTVPGPGVPPSIISGKLAANLLSNYLKQSL